jgi:SAM-dependent methyltransferase
VHKALIQRIAAVTGLGWALGALLSLCFITVRAVGRAVAFAYARSWPLLGQPYYDQRFEWLRGPGSWLWAERGVFGSQLARRGGRTLDLCCGDGLYTRHFLAREGTAADGVDRDQRAISAARSRYGSPTVRFFCRDVVSDPFPEAEYDAVTCFESLQYFAPEDAQRLFAKIAAALVARNGRFGGSVPIVRPPARHEPAVRFVFDDAAHVEQLLGRHFGHVRTWCSEWTPGLSYCYFECAMPRATAD